MDKIKNVFWLAHIVLWILLTMLVALQLKSEGDTNYLTLTFGFIITSLYIFYTHFFILTKYAGKGNRRSYIFRLSLIVFTGPFLFLIGHHEKLSLLETIFELYMMALIAIAPIFILLSWLARVVENLVLNTVEKEQLEKYAAEAELHYLKSQINPHFLFNTLHNIHTLVYKQASTAPEAVLRLASLMRYMIYESNVSMVPLEREISYLKDYISLQQLRYKNGPVVELIIEGINEFPQVAPLLFVHLLENAYKHSPAQLEAGDIKVSLQINAHSLTFKVLNPSTSNKARKFVPIGGIGLANVRKRLALLYPGKHALEITSLEDTFVVTLNIEGLK